MKAKTVFFCTDCGCESAKWVGRCPSCGSWNSLKEAPAVPAAGVSAAAPLTDGRQSKPRLLSELDASEELRFDTGLSELNRVLGGGAVRGSIVLVGGAPGIGKSTLLLQLCAYLPGERVLYISGEESQRQLKMRAGRLGVSGEKLYVLAETDLGAAVEAITEIKPDVLIIDSVQTMYNAALGSSPGSVGQVKDCTLAVMQLARTQGFTAFVVGHINKEGAIAGPKVLEHMVDCVLYFEGDRNHSYRILRAAKNRFGSTNEIGVFEMTDAGLREVENPSEMLLSGRPEDTPGTCVTCVLEGTRPILAEIQALVTPSGFNVPRRNSNGLDYNRAMLLLAVLEKRGGLPLGGFDAYVNVVGGLELDEPAADLAAVLAIASSVRDKPIGSDVAAIGEVGLTGEIRSVHALSARLSEMARLGFKKCVVPAHLRGESPPPSGLEIIPVRNIRQAMAAVFS
jgi:DNA repair protein RadA/Sms